MMGCSFSKFLLSALLPLSFSRMHMHRETLALPDGTRTRFRCCSGRPRPPLWQCRGPSPLRTSLCPSSAIDASSAPPPADRPENRSTPGVVHTPEHSTWSCRSAVTLMGRASSLIQRTSAHGTPPQPLQSQNIAHNDYFNIFFSSSR